MVAGEANRLPADGRTELSRTYRACLGSAGPRNATFRQGMVHLFPSPTDGNAKRNLLQSLRITNREFQRSSKKGFSSKRWAKNPLLVQRTKPQETTAYSASKRGKSGDWVPPVRSASWPPVPRDEPLSAGQPAQEKRDISKPLATSGAYHAPRPNHPLPLLPPPFSATWEPHGFSTHPELRALSAD